MNSFTRVTVDTVDTVLTKISLYHYLTKASARCCERVLKRKCCETTFKRKLDCILAISPTKLLHTPHDLFCTLVQVLFTHSQVRKFTIAHELTVHSKLCLPTCSDRANNLELQLCITICATIDCEINSIWQTTYHVLRKVVLVRVLSTNL